ncbi:Carbohydrate-binding WSC subgroup [Penicillium bovifimosum]|uniref:Carbohydrate-binding WSC subgroup n=1 Tax=Penicillium bovifimosum TaxID=126998 RepID=A0A9W9H4H8_9EURO|nr:Carbohydrate-binding WSC subgroup [Penicillium bovifimosum]KAJ5138505.1 Carbohydrate-binding WSC subgroup [Penicillium bovifimosum]
MFFNTRGALAATVLIAATSVVAEDFKVVPRGPLAATLVGCYSSVPGYGKTMPYTYQSSGWCQDHCSKEHGAFALTGGSDCVCGDTLPPSSEKVSTGKCSKSCSGWPQDKCGGDGYYSVYTTGLDDDIPTYSKSNSTKDGAGDKSTTKTDSAATGVTTGAGGQTQIVTSNPSASPAADTEEKTSKSKNTAAIAAGVVVGVVGFAALCGAGFFYWRSKKNKSNAASGPIGGYGRDSSPPSMTDSRFDGDYMAQRRQSNGSIDDDHDFSRRILQVNMRGTQPHCFETDFMVQVTNPDR